ncbi:K(+)-transporting ATPase subunit F [Ignavigranum ruoffiae]
MVSGTNRTQRVRSQIMIVLSVIIILLFIYLIYALVHPDKF